MAVISTLESVEHAADLPRIAGSSPEALVDEVSSAPHPNAVVVELDGAVTNDEGLVDVDALVATASVLVLLGVEHLETNYSQPVRRVFDMHRAISAGTTEVLAP